MAWIECVFGTEKPLVGVVHLLPLPGSPLFRGDLEGVLDAARTSARILKESGFDGIIFENFCDVPFLPDAVEPHVVGVVSVLLRECAAYGPCGVNLLRNAARDALAAAAAGGGAFIRVNVHVGAYVTDQGVLAGRAHETMRYRRLLGADVRVLADVRVKHAAPLAERDPIEEAADCLERGLADGLIVTGPRTGAPADLDFAARLKKAHAAAPVFVGSGVTAATVGAALRAADGVIVGTSLEESTGVIDPRRAAAFVKAARSVPRRSVRGRPGSTRP